MVRVLLGTSKTSKFGGHDNSLEELLVLIEFELLSHLMYGVGRVRIVYNISMSERKLNHAWQKMCAWSVLGVEVIINVQERRRQKC